ncbi:hypothetical protein L798_07442 [Zootermopsis nevadensis]|uniref:Uncharacterized protein n=1 Tax=Zootermopsis nevadensis TaxID=136037 RepID=A0A067R575_ZOONE|nr:hypothetical protein L798_07442 [Zootermopsis nevadensis]
MVVPFQQGRQFQSQVCTRVIQCVHKQGNWVVRASFKSLHQETKILFYNRAPRRGT